MKILLASPIFSQHFDSGLFWLSALSRLGHQVSVWDYRWDPDRDQRQFRDDLDCSIVLKGEGVDPRELPKPAFCYWPDAFGRVPSAEKALRKYQRVFTPVKPTPENMIWLPTGWEPLIHHPRKLEQISIPSLFVGTATQRKYQFLSVIQPDYIFGNGWNIYLFHEYQVISGPRYLYELVSLLHSTQIAINIHRDDIGVTRRLFEFMACTFTITDRVPGVPEILGPGLTSKVTFATPQEGLEMKEYYLNHPTEGLQLWEEEKKAIVPYTYENAVKRVLEEVLR